MHKLREYHREVTAGSLLLSGLAIVLAFILLFGLTPDLFKPSYQIAVEFSDASGVSKGADVSLSGALIGKVISDPHLIPGTRKVEITLKIDQSVKIRRDARFSIESNGLFGDKMINVRPEDNMPGKDRSPYMQNGDTVQGVQKPDLSTLIASSITLIHRATRVADQLDAIVTRLNKDVLTHESTEDLKETSLKIRSITVKSKQLAANSDDLISALKSGDGVLGELLYDKSVRRDLKDFIASYRAHGAIFYSDDTAPPPTHLRSRPPWRARP